MEQNMEKEYNYFLENKDKFFELYFNRFIIIKDCEVKGDFKTIDKAMKFAVKNFEIGTFIVERCSPESQEPQTYHSRVLFG